MLKQMMAMGFFFRAVDGLQIELLQAIQEGKDIQGLQNEMATILQMDDANIQKMKAAENFYDKVSALPTREGYKYNEPSDLPGIRNARPETSKKLDIALPNDDVLNDKIYGAWLGRCAGCLLGKPVELWKRERINNFAKDTGNFPIRYYFSSNVSDEIKKKYQISDVGFMAYGSNVVAWINNVNAMPVDDDTNYTILGLMLLEQYGVGFTNIDVAENWINNLPAMHAMTAERVSYRNIISGILPPDSGWRRNPYREWIGAQIRADIYGYVAAGNPELAAEMAWRDASISHFKNGIYGEMFVAATLASAAVIDNLEEIINHGLNQIPQESRLAEGVIEVLKWKEEAISWEQAIDRIHGRYNEANINDWCHTVSNAMIVCLALLFGEKDMEKSIAIAVHSAFDTDCNGATVGSIVGMILGAKSLPNKLTDPLNDTVLSTVAGFAESRISDLAKRTVDLIKKVNFEKDHQI
jgi:ADP-ribosylglycohydrolase